MELAKLVDELGKDKAYDLISRQLTYPVNDEKNKDVPQISMNYTKFDEEYPKIQKFLKENSELLAMDRQGDVLAFCDFLKDRCEQQLLNYIICIRIYRGGILILELNNTGAKHGSRRYVSINLMSLKQHLNDHLIVKNEETKKELNAFIWVSIMIVSLTLWIRSI